MTFILQNFGSVGKGQTNIFFIRPSLGSTLILLQIHKQINFGDEGINHTL